MTLDEVCKEFGINEIGDFSDGYHTFNQLYHQRAVLFATIVNQNSSIAWKSYRHENGELCFGGGWFIVGIDTPEGSYTYHYNNKYWNMFGCAEIEKGKPWDGHTEEDVTRLLSLTKNSNSQMFIECRHLTPNETKAKLEKYRSMASEEKVIIFFEEESDGQFKYCKGNDNEN